MFPSSRRIYEAGEIIPVSGCLTLPRFIAQKRELKNVLRLYRSNIRCGLEARYEAGALKLLRNVMEIYSEQTW